MNIYLHIGLYKTGTTYFQKILLKELTNHFDIITLYDDGGKKIKKNKKFQVQYNSNRELIINLILYINNPNDKIKEKINKLIQKYKKPIIISSETFFGHPSNGFFDRKKYFLNFEKIFNKPKYIIFFREPSEILLSSYNQALKKNIYTGSFKEYVNKNIDLLSNTKIKNFTQGTNYKIYNYNNLFKDYLNINDRVIFIDYNKFFYGNNLDFNKFTKFININFYKRNFTNKINASNKNLIYFNYFNKFFLFKSILFFLRILNRLKLIELSFVLEMLISFLNKYHHSKEFQKIKLNLDNYCKYIKNFHKNEFEMFKKKLM